MRPQWFGDQAAEPVAWLIDGLLPQEGVCLLTGQTGVGKTFIAIELAAAIIAGAAFAGKRVERPGSCIMIAREGAFEIPIRFRAAANNHKRQADVRPQLPFGWLRECPPLIDPASLQKLCDMTVEA